MEKDKMLTGGMKEAAPGDEMPIGVCPGREKPSTISGRSPLTMAGAAGHQWVDGLTC